MTLRKTLLAGLALAVAIAFSPLPELQAATLVNPGSQPAADTLVHTVKAKKKYKKVAKYKKRAKKVKKAS